jgi:voltage-gated potassium channel
LDTKVEKGLDFSDIVILVLSIYVLVAFAIDVLIDIPIEIRNLINYFDNFICIIFLIEFIYKLTKSENKRQYLKWGWIDLLSSIPNLEIFRGGRFIRIIRIIRLIRAVKSLKEIHEKVFEKKAEGAVKSIFLIAFLLIICSSISILLFEKSGSGNISTAGDAIWWSLTTITTVGYGDLYPVTFEGRIVAVILMFFGVGLFGTISAYFSSKFIK